MNHIRTESLQLGETGWILGDLPNLLAGSLEVEIYACSNCGKLEFFTADESEERLPQKQCPNCGKMHDFDYPKYPYCKYDYDT
jgi:DNA-directed RNA polymerase subunit RPC12/RpoP